MAAPLHTGTFSATAWHGHMMTRHFACYLPQSALRLHFKMRRCHAIAAMSRECLMLPVGRKDAWLRGLQTRSFHVALSLLGAGDEDKIIEFPRAGVSIVA